MDAKNFPQIWVDLVNAGKLEDILKLYNEKSTLMPTFSPHTIRTQEGLRNYFTQLGSRDGLNVSLHANTVSEEKLGETAYLFNGIYTFRFKVDDTLLTFESRFTFVLDTAYESPVLHHHSSQIPRTLS